MMLLIRCQIDWPSASDCLPVCLSVCVRVILQHLLSRNITHLACTDTLPSSLCLDVCPVISWLATMWGRSIVMVRVVRLSVTRKYLLSEIDILWLLRNSNRKPGSRFRINSQIRGRKYGSAIWGVSVLALRPFRQKQAGWASKWLSGNSHQSGPHWALWRASYRDDS